MDRPTRGTLAHLGASITEETPEASGIDDDQMPAFSTVPAVLTAGPESPSLEEDVARMVRVTNDNPIAIEGALILSRVVRSVLQGEDVMAALTTAAERAGDQLQPLLRQALGSSDRTSVDIAGQFGRACHVPQGLPVVFHIIANTDSYASAIRTNVMAGGDTCGRAMALGAILGAHYGFGGARGMPLPWLTRLQGGARLLDEAYQLSLIHI